MIKVTVEYDGESATFECEGAAVAAMVDDGYKTGVYGRATVYEWSRAALGLCAHVNDVIHEGEGDADE